MNLSIVKIIDRGVPNKERLWLKALRTTELYNYIVVKTNYVGTEHISAGSNIAYWFQNQKINFGDNIILYSGSGTNSQTKNKDGTTSYFFYWGLEKTIWNNIDDCAVVFEIYTWDTTKKGL